MTASLCSPTIPMPHCAVQLFIAASPARQAYYRQLLEAIGLPGLMLVERGDADAVLLAEGGESLLDASLPGLAEPELASLLPRCVGTVVTPEYPSLLEGLSRLQSLLYEDGPQTGDHRDGLVAISPLMRQLRNTVAQLAGKPVTVMITGPSGAGKELVARAIHRMSERAQGPFVPINCGAIPRELLESELFGHERGAFTGAISSRAGRFELAHGGTLFLDEIGDMPLDMQVKILRAIQERSFERVGSCESRTADVRIVAATHRDLPSMIADGQFREDLYYRLNVFPLSIPPLSERREDIPALIDSLSVRLAEEGLPLPRFTPAALDALQGYDWPGNVRELANLLERLAVSYPDKLVGVHDLPGYCRGDRSAWIAPSGGGELPSPDSGLSLKEELAALERRRITQALEASGQVVSRAAERLGLRRTTLIEKMRKYGIAAA
ncbi:sigma-54 interaction domain-containing protein [Spongiibacter tropicus]|mgnify:FL=1|uniref:sigma-54 interaction domain-containing protein n=2 Tax=Spongiibacter TaxID=630749 RepID=UPI002352E69C|nr:MULTISPECIES: sigma-54 dependent transcriptional regulator [Spongiibacter]